MANYIVSANTNPDRNIRTNGAGLSKSIKVLLDEGYDSVTVIPEKKRQPKFKVGDRCRIIDNTVHHHFLIGDTVIITGIFHNEPDGEYGYRCSGYTNGKPDVWAVVESNLAEI